jgi:biotin carboxylase
MGKTPTVFFIGAGLLQSFAIKRAREMGCHVVAVDRNPESPGFTHAHQSYPVDIKDLPRCLDIARACRADAVLGIASEWGAVTAAHIARALHLPGTNPDIYKVTRNKYLTARRLHAAGIDLQRQVHLVNEKTAGETCPLNCPVMVKPVDGAGSVGVTLATNVAELQRAVETAKQASLAGDVLVESYIAGREFGVESFVFAGEVHVLLVMEKLMTSPPAFAELAHLYPPRYEEPLIATIRQTVTNVIKTLEIDAGPVNADVIVDHNSQVHVVDISARMGGNLIGSHIVPYATGIDLNRQTILWALGEQPDLQSTRSAVVVSRLLDMEPRPGVVHTLEGLDQITAQPGVLDLILTIKPGMPLRAYRTNHDSAGYAVVTGENVDVALALAEKVKRLLHEAIRCKTSSR